MIVQVWQVTELPYLKSNMTFIVSLENFEHIGFHLRSNRVINWMGERGNVSEKYRGNTSTTVRRHQYQYWDINILIWKTLQISRQDQWNVEETPKRQFGVWRHQYQDQSKRQSIKDRDRKHLNGSENTSISISRRCTKEILRNQTFRAPQTDITRTMMRNEMSIWI